MSFDLLAPHYRWMEFVVAGEKLQRCRKAFLDQIPAPRNALLLGEGHGRCLVECRRRFSHARLTCVDASHGMLMESERRLEKHHLDLTKLKFIQADALSWNPDGEPFDLIITNFFLDCFRAHQLETLIAKLAANATPNANWLIADFQVASGRWKRLRSRLILWSMYVFFRVVTRLPAEKLTPPDPFLKQAGFHLQRRNASEWGLLHSDWWSRNGKDIPQASRLSCTTIFTSSSKLCRHN